MSLNAASPSALLQEPEPGQQAGLQGHRPGLGCQRLSAGGGERAVAGLGSLRCTDTFGNPGLGFLSICGWGVPAGSMGFLGHLTCSCSDFAFCSHFPFQIPYK